MSDQSEEVSPAAEASLAARSYADSASCESATRGPGRTEPEVWLRGNVRPVAWLAVPSVGLAMLAVTAAAASGAAPAIVWSLWGATAAVAAAWAALAIVAARPRLGRRGNALLVRLSPWRAEEVPLDVVECIFHGSQPLAGAALAPAHAHDPPAGPPPVRRVGTLVVRLAERATAWRDRPAFGPWGAWEDGHVVVDGRWCEPLSVALARGIGTRLAEAKRAAGADA